MENMYMLNNSLWSTLSRYCFKALGRSMTVVDILKALFSVSYKEQ